MRHPFDGINGTASTSSNSNAVTAEKTDSRRSWLKGLLATFAGLFAWNRVQNVQAEKEINLLLPPQIGIGADIQLIIGPDGLPIGVGPNGVAGGGPNDPEPMDMRVSSAVRGEEGASVSTNPGGATRALNEVGITQARREIGGPVTGALNEEGLILPPGMFTTLALGEEGGR